MRTIALLSSKGGTGKTTVALHLAAAGAASGRKTLVADLDPQRSACDWARDRKSSKPAVMETRAGCLFVAHQAAERGGVELMVLDTAPSAGDEAAQAMRLADLSLIVVRPTALDLRAIARTAEMARRLNRRAVFVINQAPSRRRGREPACIDRAIETLHAYGLPIAPAGLRSRSIYQSALGRGLLAQEADPRSAAAAEVRALWRFAARELWRPTILTSAPARPRPVFSPVAQLVPAAAALRPAG